jgi:methionine synthase II (cobalamin-independent)
MYNDDINEKRPHTLSSFMDLFISCAKKDFFIILLDAFDECDEHERVYSQLIQPLYNAGIKVFITHRPHVIINPEIDFQDFTRMEIQARDEDIESYIRGQPKMQKKAKHLDDTFTLKIIEAIKHNAKGMYTC